MAAKKSALGFGFLPEQSQQHFLVTIPKSNDELVIIHERFQWHDGMGKQTIDEIVDKPKAQLSKHKWKLIEDALKMEFNHRLKKDDILIGKWRIGQNPVEKLLGKEMLLLVWAIEDSDPSVIPIAIRNWRGLSAEERWWLFTMTNASSGNIHDNRGWRKAVRYALTENPIDEKNKQLDLFELLINQQKNDV